MQTRTRRRRLTARAAPPRQERTAPAGQAGQPLLLWLSHDAPLATTNALSSAAPEGGRLRRMVRPEGQTRAPSLEDGRSPRKSAGPQKRRSAARMIAGIACYTSAGRQKGLKLAQ